MLTSIALFISLCFISFQGISAVPSPVGKVTHAPKRVSVNDLFHRRSQREAIALLGRKYLLDSSHTELTDPAMKWSEHLLDSTHYRNKAGKSSITQLVFAPVIFEGDSAKVTILFLDTTSFGAIVSVPYPPKLHSQLTDDDFSKIAVNIQKSMGLPTISTGRYIDYVVDAHQSLFGQLRDGIITINIMQLGS